MPQNYMVLTNRIMKPHNNGVKHVDIELTRHLINMFVKLGFMLLAKDSIKETNGIYPNIRAYVEYHLYSFVYSSKSFLDSIAITLNYVYNLGLAKGDIDLNKSLFIKKIEEKHPSLLVIRELKNIKKWISGVIIWRDELIHRCVTTVVPYGTAEEISDYSRIMMPLKPIRILDHEQMNCLERKYNRPPMREILPFCDEWISNAKLIVERLGDDLLTKYNTPQ